MKTAIILLLFIFTIVAVGVFTVDSRESALVSNYWQKDKVYTSGLHFAWPGIETVNYVYMNERTSILTLPSDFQFESQVAVKAEVLVNWHVVEPVIYFNSLQVLNQVGFNKALIKVIVDNLRSKNIAESALLVLSKNNTLFESPLTLSQLGIVVDKIAINNLIILQQAPLTAVIKASESSQVSFISDAQVSDPSIAQRQIESAYYRAQEIKTQTDIDQAQMYQEIKNLNPRFYAYFRKIEVYKNTAKSKSDIPPLQQLYAPE